MFNNDPVSLTHTLSQMEALAREKTNFSEPAAKAKMAEWLANDRRFDNFDKARLIERVQRCKYNGAVLDLDDPQLKRGGQPRPLDRWR